MKKRALYPGTEEAERERARKARRLDLEEEPADFIGGKPNYDKFPGRSPERVLAWLNID